METCDALIVGGGPAGSTCAWRLSQSNFDVLVLDKKEFPRDKTCAGWVTPAVLDSLHFEAEQYRLKNVLQPITGFRTGLIGGNEVQNFYEHPVSYGIRRCEFDHYLLQRTSARQRLGESLKTAERSGDRWIINGEIETPLLIGAGGHFCPIARMLGARQDPKASVVAAQEIEFEAPLEDLNRGTIAAEIPELFFCRDLKGYGWCFRKGNYLNIGLGRVDRQKLSEHVSDFADFLRERNKVKCEIPQKFHGHAYQLYERSQPLLADKGVLLIGDAAGLAYPQSGEGIRPAVESGLLAADVVMKSQGLYSAENLAPYRDQILNRFGTPRGKGIADLLPAGWLHFLASRLLASKWFSRHVVIDRWFLHTNQPALSL